MCSAAGAVQQGSASICPSVSIAISMRLHAAAAAEVWALMTSFARTRLHTAKQATFCMPRQIQPSSRAAFSATAFKLGLCLGR